MLQCIVLMCGRSVTAFLATLEVSAKGKGPARPTQRPALCLYANQLDLYISSADDPLFFFRASLCSL
jgi:hypothetical protein